VEDDRAAGEAAQARVSGRLAELLGSLSLATDLAAGLPAETAIRTSLFGYRLAAAHGVQGFALADVYFTGLLRFLGCSAYSYEMAARFGAGDDLGLLRELTYANSRRPGEIVRGALRGIDRRAPLRHRAAAFVRLATSPETPIELGTTHCELAVLLARRLGMSEGVVAGLSQVYESWDGRGGLAGARGEAIELTSRLVQVAWRLAAHFPIGGAPEAIDAIEQRRGTELDPKLVDLAVRESSAIFADARGAHLWKAFLAAEPRPAVHVPADRTPALARVFADFADVKSPWTVGHSVRVAELARAAAAAGGSPDDAPSLELAGLLHDVGRTAIPNGIWDKPGLLLPYEREQMQSHAFETERVLSRSPLFADVAALASMAHERLDGSGYHRALRTTGLARSARVLAAADAYVALTQDRPHRAARSAAEAKDVLAVEAAAGRYCADAVDAVLAAVASMAHERGRRAAVPHALTAATREEVEIIRLVSRGLANKEIAARTNLSASTVERHLENVFDKIGLRTRAAISVWALEHDLLGDHE
jgi:HD-GYP domain-containing protein (c-di-GMP phosphodiesterase class II)